MVNDMFRVRTAWTNGPVGGGVSTFYFLVNSPDTTKAQTCVDKVRDFWAALKPSIHPTFAWSTGGLVDNLNYDTGVLQGSFSTTPRVDSGTGTGDLLPLSVQGMIRWETGFIVNGKRFRGRTFIPGVTENSSISIPTAPLTTNAASAVTAINLADATLPFQVWHRPTVAGGMTDGTTRGVVTGTLQPKFMILRSRRD